MSSIDRLRTFSLLLVLCVGGCVTTRPPIPSPRAIPLPVPEPEPAVPSPEEIRRRNVEFFLARAEEALHQGHLIYPAGASAYDYYLRAKQLDPDNRRAAGGIQTIVIEFVDRARNALRKSAFGEVNTYLSRAEELAPGNPLVMEVRTQLARELSRANQELPQGESLGLPAGQLDAKSDTVVALLHRAAERIRSEGLRVIIVARTDAEGRWIYQQLREAVPGYRVRGDIKLGSPPRLLLQPSGSTE